MHILARFHEKKLWTGEDRPKIVVMPVALNSHYYMVAVFLDPSFRRLRSWKVLAIFVWRLSLWLPRSYGTLLKLKNSKGRAGISVFLARIPGLSFFWLPKRANRDISCIATKVRKLQIYPLLFQHTRLEYTSPLPLGSF